MKRPKAASRFLPLLALLGGVSTAAALPYPFHPDRSVSLALAVNATSGLGTAKIQLVQQQLNSTATLSWEIGTHAQALLEYLYPTLSPFSADSIPLPSSPTAYEVITIASGIVSSKANGALPLMQDGSSGDPASVGVSVILANLTTSSSVLNLSRTAYAIAADNEVLFLLTKVPRSSSGAISHRVADVELWSDFVYMAPPFLAYYGVVKGNTTVIQAAYDQCRLYRDALKTSNGLWSHISPGTNVDPGLWATGNGWAAAGMLRVYATILRSSYSSQFSSQLYDLSSWVQEIVQAAFALQRSDGFLPNYFNSNTTTFSDAASTALLAASYYRLLFLSQNSSSLPTLAVVERSRQAVYNGVSSTTGVLSPVVDPLKYSAQGTQSPEGEAFVLLMESAWSDWYVQENGAGSVNESIPVAKSGAARGGGQAVGAELAALVSVVVGGWTLL